MKHIYKEKHNIENKIKHIKCHSLNIFSLCEGNGNYRTAGSDVLYQLPEEVP